jgi:hypothetical protein
MRHFGIAHSLRFMTGDGWKVEWVDYGPNKARRTFRKAANLILAWPSAIAPATLPWATVSSIAYD